MKRISLLVLLIFSITIFQNCKKDSKEDASQEQVTQDDAKYVIETDKLSDDLAGIIDISAFDNTSNRNANNNPNLPSCVSYTIDRTSLGHVDITLIFDANGCTIHNRVYRGTVTIARDYDFTNQTFSGSIVFTDLYVDDIHVEGSSTFTHVHANSAGHPQSTYDYDYNFTFPNGDVAQRDGHKVREWSEGYNTPTPNDNVFLVTGNAHILRRNGVELEAEVTTPLRREFACPYFVSGTMNISKNGQTAVLDFGNGNCDDEATLTLSNGQVLTIHL